eukprot:9167326-Alexandrium_andersonii.AAC.1
MECSGLTSRRAARAHAKQRATTVAPMVLFSVLASLVGPMLRLRGSKCLLNSADSSEYPGCVHAPAKAGSPC